MWTGAFKESASFIFSGSIKISGKFLIIRIIKIIETQVETTSLKVNEFPNSIFSRSSLVPNGLLDPVLCNNKMWIKMKNVIKNGMIKWIEKNRFNVGCLTEKFPYIHFTKEIPI